MQKIRTELVIIGGSAGSLQVILDLVRGLERKLDFPIVFVIHRKAQSTSILQSLLQQFTDKQVIEIEDKTEIENDKISLLTDKKI